jgi:hypothetical protein
MKKLSDKGVHHKLSQNIFKLTVYKKQFFCEIANILKQQLKNAELYR